MTPAEAQTIALREMNRQYKTLKFNVMADPRANEIRLVKMAELELAMTILDV